MWGHFDSTVEVFRAFFVVDCESASQAIEHDGGFDLAFVLQEVRDLRWTPLTGKNQTGGHRALLLRARNTAADEAAGGCMERRRRGSQRQAWAAVVKQAAEWEVQAMTSTSSLRRSLLRPTHDYLRTRALDPARRP